MSAQDDSRDAKRYRWLRENIGDLIDDGLAEAAYSCHIPITQREFTKCELLDMIADYCIAHDAHKAEVLK